LNVAHKIDFKRLTATSVAVVLTSVAAVGWSSSGGALTSHSKITNTVLGKLTGADPKHLGGGLTIKLGVDLPLTGSQTFYGLGPLKAIKLAIAQVKAAGGPNFKLQIEDDQSDNPQAVVQNVRNLGQAGVPIMIESFGAGSLAALPGIAQYHILTMDGIGGASPGGGTGQKWFFGTRGRDGSDVEGGIMDYLHQKYPTVKTVAVVAGNYGAASTAAEQNAVNTALAANGLTLASFDSVQFGTTDYSSEITKLNAEKPDAVYVALAGADPGVFYKQFRASGSTIPAIGFDLNGDMIAAAGTALDGWTFGTEYFGTVIAHNPWGQYFIKSYAKAYPGEAVPASYAANSYEDVIAFWKLVQRVLAKHGNPNNSNQLRLALLADPTFPTVYGNSSTVGSFTINRTTHTPTSRHLGIYQWNGTTVQVLATYDIGGKNFKLIK
jgi:ABC-type branched-subunit amino acid transport system substrate-binding protein